MSRRATAVGLGLLLTVTACAASPTPQQQQRAAMQPTGRPAEPVRPIADPRDTREVVGQGFRLAVPSAFQQFNAKSSNGEPLLALRRASRVPAVPIQVAVLREPNPGQDVIEQSYALEVTKRTLGQATDIVRSSLVWPGAQKTVLVQWTQSLPATGGTTVATRYWQLNSQVSDRLILVVVGFAPAAEFSTSQVAEIVGTFRIR
jgi:hypothetical protein